VTYGTTYVTTLQLLVCVCVCVYVKWEVSRNPLTPSQTLAHLSTK